MRTFIKWSGNKSKHINKFIKYIPDFNGTYFEPFVGSGALLLKLEPEHWVINDFNKDLINIWKSIKNNPNEIIKEFKKFEKNFINLDKANKVNYCREITSKIDSLKYDYKRASTYLLMKYCIYMGNIVSNNKFYFNSLDLNIQKHDRCFFLEEPTLNNIKDVSEYLNESNGKIYNRSYEEILKKTKDGDFVFLDPPYIEDHNYGFNYNKDEVLDESFINKLLKELQKLDDSGVMWLMTQADTKEIRQTFKDYTIKTMKVYRAGKKEYVNELIIFNYEIS